MKARFTISDIAKSKVAHLNPHITDEPKVKKPSKFRNTPTVVNEIRFDSKKEAKRYKDLLLLLKGGKIGLLRLQVGYELNPGGTYSYKYVADFVYIDSQTGKEVVEDTKGYRKVEYKKKRRLMKKVHGITIIET